MKKVATLILALVLVMTLASPALAGDEPRYGQGWHSVESARAESSGVDYYSVQVICDNLEEILNEDVEIIFRGAEDEVILCLIVGNKIVLAESLCNGFLLDLESPVKEDVLMIREDIVWRMLYEAL